MHKSNEGVVEMQTTSHGIVADGAPIIYYDGSCPLCTVEIKYYASRVGESKLHLVDVSAEGGDISSDLSAKDAMNRFHVRKPDGELVSGAKAFAEVWRVVPGWAWVSRLARIPYVLSVVEVTYSGFLVVRPSISWLAARFGVQAENPQPKRHLKMDEPFN